MRNNLVALATVLATSLGAISFGGFHTTAQAAILVVGGGAAHDCYLAARRVVRENTRDSAAVLRCTEAIDKQPLSDYDRAATYNNRGILYFASSAFDKAAEDFGAAISTRPELGEPYINQGAVLVRLGQYARAITEIDKGLMLNPGDPERAYFNRAVAEEWVNDQQDAYRDYRRSAELKPGWELPRLQMARFTVMRRPAQQ